MGHLFHLQTVQNHISKYLGDSISAVLVLHTKLAESGSGVLNGDTGKSLVAVIWFEKEQEKLKGLSLNDSRDIG